jgi:hypothetical protein
MQSASGKSLRKAEEKEDFGTANKTIENTRSGACYLGPICSPRANNFKINL